VYVYGRWLPATTARPPATSTSSVAWQREPGQVTTRELTSCTPALAATGGPAGQLHCLYVAADAASDPERLCNLLVRDRMNPVADEAAHASRDATAGVALYWSVATAGIEPVPVADIQAARARGGHRLLAPDSPQARCWLQDSWVDHGLVVLPRAEAVADHRRPHHQERSDQAAWTASGPGLPGPGDPPPPANASPVTVRQAAAGSSPRHCSPAASCTTASPPA